MEGGMSQTVVEQQQEAASPTPAVPPGRQLTRRRMLVALAVAVLVLVVLAVVVFVGGGDDGKVTVKGPSGEELSVEKPDGWSELSKNELQALPGNPVAVLRRDDGGGLVVLNAQEGAAQDLRQVSGQLDRRLRKELPDFRKVSSRRVRVKAGPALLYSYARKQKGTAHTILVVPTEGRSYTLNAAVGAGEDQAARGAGKILFSFDR
jgi:hypothetical protein